MDARSRQVSLTGLSVPRASRASLGQRPFPRDLGSEDRRSDKRPDSAVHGICDARQLRHRRISPVAVEAWPMERDRYALRFPPILHRAASAAWFSSASTTVKSSSNKALERTATSRGFPFPLAWTRSLRSTRAFGSRRSSYSR